MKIDSMVYWALALTLGFAPRLAFASEPSSSADDQDEDEDKDEDEDEDEAEQAFFFNLTPGILESFSPAGQGHFGFYVSLNADFLIPVGERGASILISPGFEVGQYDAFRGAQWGPIFGLVIDQVIAEPPRVTISVEPQVGYFLNVFSHPDPAKSFPASHNLYAGVGFAFMLPSGLTFIPTLTVSTAHTFTVETVAINPTFMVAFPVY